YMGIHNVVFTSLENFSLPLVRDEAPARENVPSWKPVLKESMIANKKELREYAQKVTAFPSVIDVRSESEYLREKNHVFNAINIPWIEFLDKRGEPNFALRKKLEQLGLGESQRVIVIGNDGNTGALAAFVLMKMGFTKVGLYAGGYRAMVGSTSAK
ncbi:MAG: rhodanese-like domain-containing protein, partial [Pseudobdellovibrionaceae bacterium]